MKQINLFLLGATTLTLVACGAQDEATVPAETPSTTVETNSEKPEISANKAFLDLAASHAKRIIRTDPETATILGLGEDIAGQGFQARLGSYSPLARDEIVSLNDRLYQDLQQVDRSALSGTAAVTYDVLAATYELSARRNQFQFGGGSVLGGVAPYPINQITGPHLSLPRLLLTQHPFETRQDAEDYLSRLIEMGRALDEARDAMILDAEAGVVPPIFALTGAAGSIETFIDAAPADHLLVTYFAGKIEDLPSLSAEDRETMVATATANVADTVYPAFTRLVETLRSFTDAAGPDAGIWRLDEGEAFYQLTLTAYGAGNMSADDVHELGLREVERISGEMNAIMDELGTPAAETAGMRFSGLKSNPDLVYPNTDEAKEELLEELRGQVEEINLIAPQWFGTLPPQEVEVRRIPVYEQDSSAGGYYTSPSLDGSRPGIYWINLKDTADWPKYSLKALTYHEAVPGHHFQIGLQQAVEDMPLIRNMLYFSEFGEGWALYAEKLAEEMGMFENDPLGNLGRLQSELFRAGRLVVDTGLHHKRWSREEAIDWMTKYTGETRASVTREVERYAVWPGQATSYKLGMIRIEELRAEAEAELGARFDIRAFHDVVLLSGAVPLPVLEANVAEWVANQKGL